MVQLVVNEYNAALNEHRDINWSELTIAALHELCQQQAAQCPGWPPDISNPTLNVYFGEIPPNKLWWNFLPEVALSVEDGTHVFSMCFVLMCQVLIVTMNDPPAPPPPPPVPPVPSTSRPVCARRAAKGKEPEVVVSTPPKAGGSQRGTKQHVPDPDLAGPQDVAPHTTDNVSLSHVQVELPSSWPVSPDPPLLASVTALGDVSPIIL